MFTVYKKEFEWGGRPFTLETGKVARQADGAVVATYGGTTVLATVCYAKSVKEGVDFFPLTVNYQEKYYAAGRIPGGFFKREGRPTERETLVCRLTDRPIRPLFPKAFRNETQIITTVLTSDGETDPDTVSMIAASAALTISGIPFLGPIGAARVGYVDGEFVINPTADEREDSALDLVVAGTREGVTMVESEASELSEDVMLDAVVFGHKEFTKAIDAIIELAEAAAKPGYEMPEVEDTSALAKALKDGYGDAVVEAYGIKAKLERQGKLGEIKEKAVEDLGGEEGENADKVKALFKEMEADVLRGSLLSSKVRIDGRKTTDIRPIVAEVDVLPGTHGSALFTRGETQAIVVATLGTGKDEQLIDSMHGEYKDNFMLHYNFPPFSVGECGRMGGTSRREVGHGKLARRALEAMLPKESDNFPYTIRLVSEITESNGSSSMATICGSSLAMMAAGVPMPKPVSGIAMGLVKEGDDYAVLSDILGDEDHLGDMDFKVAGTKDGITALQMDIKITSITKDIMKEALAQARDGRLHILGKMGEALTEARSEISDCAPQMHTIVLPKDKIRDVIGSGGSVIRGLIEETGAQIDIDDEGICRVASADRASLDDCVKRIEDIIAEAEVGETYTGPVTRVTDFGAFVKCVGSAEGLVHISEIVPIRLASVESILSEGDIVTVKCTDIDERGKVRLTMKEIPQSDEIQAKMDAAVEGGDQEIQKKPRDDRGGRDRGGRGDRDRRPRRA